MIQCDSKWFYVIQYKVPVGMNNLSCGESLPIHYESHLICILHGGYVVPCEHPIAILVIYSRSLQVDAAVLYAGLDNKAQPLLQIV